MTRLLTSSPRMLLGVAIALSFVSLTLLSVVLTLTGTGTKLLIAPDFWWVAAGAILAWILWQVLLRRQEVLEAKRRALYYNKGKRPLDKLYSARNNNIPDDYVLR